MKGSLNTSNPLDRFGRVLAALTVAVLFLCSSRTQAEPEKGPAPNYKQAVKFGQQNLRQHIYDGSLIPNWIGKTDVFWYQFRTSKGTNWYRVNPKQLTREALFDRAKLGSQLSEMTQKPVEATQLPLTRVSLNDTGDKMKFVVSDFQYEYDLQGEKLAKLGKAPPAPPQQPAGPGGGQFQRRQFEQERRDDQQQDQQDQQQQQEKTEQTQGKAGSPGKGPDYKNRAPDKKTYVFARRHNLYLAEEGKEDAAVQLTSDGTEDYTFSGTGFGPAGLGGGGTTAANDDRKTRSSANWSKDSKLFHVTRSDSRGVKELFLVDSIANPRPTLQKYKYAMPGEEAVRKTELYVGDREAKKLTRVKPKWKDESYSDLHWGKTSDELRFVRTDRPRRNIEFCTLNTHTGEAKCLVAEGFEAAFISPQPVRYLDESDEMIWWSERSGWGHFYLYGRDGKLKNPITSGDFRASRIVAVDPKKRVMFFTGNAREPNENVYYNHLYCVRLDGTGLTLMGPGDGHHTSVLSPSREFVVDYCSRVDLAPVMVLRDAKGNKIMDLEKTDLSRLHEAGWKMPEAFVVKAADGVTDLYGNMWKPFDFDPRKKYPIIAHVYPGPQQEGVTHTFSALSPNQQLAQIGFIVIQVGHRGGTPTRSKAYHAYSYFNMRDFGLGDKKYAIEQLAARFPFIDSERVGIYGHSGGGFMSAAALLQKPYNEFFKAAVASAGNHDNNVYNNSWAERYHGLREVAVTKDGVQKEVTKKAGTGKGTGTQRGGIRQDRQEDEDEEAQEVKKDDKKDETKKDDKKDSDVKKDEKTPPQTKFEIRIPTNAELAANLKGALLLVHGEIDNNVHPANTMRLADALIKANKRFDMLIIPGKRHSFADAQPYFQQRMWEFFAEHLLGHKPRGADILEK